MTDKPLPTHEDIETVIRDEPLKVIARLPDCIESREARRLVDVLTDLVHQSIEKAERER